MLPAVKPIKHMIGSLSSRKTILLYINFMMPKKKSWRTKKINNLRLQFEATCHKELLYKSRQHSERNSCRKKMCLQKHSHLEWIYPWISLYWGSNKLYWLHKWIERKRLLGLFSWDFFCYSVASKAWIYIACQSIFNSIHPKCITLHSTKYKF